MTIVKRPSLKISQGYLNYLPQITRMRSLRAPTRGITLKLILNILKLLLKKHVKFKISRF